MSIPKYNPNAPGYDPSILSPIDQAKGAAVRFRVEGQSLLIHDIQGRSESQIRREISRILEDGSIRTIRFDPGLDTSKKRMLSGILAKNHPLVEVLRLIPGNDVLNVSFSGIKKLNDTYGQSFVDALTVASKQRMMYSMESHVGAQGRTSDHIRMVRDDYKNLTLSLPPGSDISSLLFQGILSKEIFLREILRDMDPVIRSLSREKGIPVETIRADVLKNWNF